jgi:hypothetical protein
VIERQSNREFFSYSFKNAQSLRHYLWPDPVARQNGDAESFI